MMEQDAQSNQSNPLLDAWMDGQKTFFKAQKEWLESTTEFAEKMETPQSFAQAEEHWEICQEQYKTWMKAMENWFPSIAEFNNKETDITAETIKRMLDPSNFLNSGLDEINQAFFKLVDAPELADIGTFERTFLKTSKDWAQMKKASADYMKITSDAWSKSFTEYTKELNNKSFDENGTAKDFLDRWLNIANKNLVKIQRSDEFLKAQRELVSASTQYKIKQREVFEAWSESVSMPTRTEVDDLHETVYQLRRELRKLKREVSELKKDKSVIKEKSTKLSKDNSKGEKT